MRRKVHEATHNPSNLVNCWGSGKPFREFLHVDDLADAILFALENWNPQSKDAPKDLEGNPLLFLNVGTGIDISIKELAELISSEIGYEGEIKWDKSKPDGTPKKQLDVKHLSKMVWNAKIKLREGIRSTILEFKKAFEEGSLRE